MALQSITPLATVTLQSASTSVVFSSIPSNYRDLVLVVNGFSSAATQLIMRFNSSNSGYSEVAMLGFSSGITSYTVAVSYISQMSMGTSGANNIVHILDYSQNNKSKTVLIRADNGGSSTLACAGRWSSNDPINLIAISPESGGVTFNQGTNFSLYGRIA